tara:strand:- start:206 stop:925 length:720 start_codon:yes stop_codon:yes gene_type:complete
MSFQEINWTDETIEEFWRYWSERPDAYFTEALGDTVVRFTKKDLGRLGAVLDFGAGSGGLLSALSREGTRCYGLDFGQDSKDRLAKRFADDKNIKGIIGLSETSKFEQFFDIVFLIETIEHMPERHLEPSIEAILSVLKPGGSLVVSTPNDEDLKAAEIYCPVSKITFHPMQHLRSWNAHTLSQYLTEAGFDAVNCWEGDIQALPYHSRSEWVKRFLKRIINRSYKDPHLIAFARKSKD